MSKINIQGIKDIDDSLYRYKMMKPVVTKLKTKTELSNLDAVCKDLNRTPHMLIEFLKKKFGTNFVQKDNKYTTTKVLSYEEIMNTIREFIEYFVLCPNCKLPETECIIDKKLNISCKCCSFSNDIVIKNKIVQKTIDSLIK